VPGAHTIETIFPGNKQKDASRLSASYKKYKLNGSVPKYFQNPTNAPKWQQLLICFCKRN